MQRETTEAFPLSIQQERLWRLQRHGDGSAYRAQCRILIEGKLDEKILISALCSIVDRYEILRTSFAHLPGFTIPAQVITGAKMLISNFDLSEFDPAALPDRLEAILNEASNRPFDIERGPTLHVCLNKLSANKHLLNICLPALSADAATLKNLMYEIGRDYTARILGNEAEDAAGQYVDFSAWQTELLESEDSESERGYWKKQDLLGLTDLKLPFETPAPKEGKFNPRVETSFLDESLSAKVGALARTHNCSPSAVLLTCLQILLFRLTERTDTVTGVAFDGRPFEGMEDALGPFVKYIPVRFRLDGDASFSHALKQVIGITEEMFDLQVYFSWGPIIESSGASTDAPLLQVGFDYQERPEKYYTGDVTFSIEQQYVCAERLKLRLSCIQDADSLVTEFHYDPEILSQTEVARLAAQFHTLLRSVVYDTQAPISQLEMMSRGEKELLDEINNTKAPYDDVCIHHLFERQVARAPGNIAVVSGQKELTYAELNARANQLAHHLRKLGVGPDVLVAICLERSLEMVISITGVLKAGGAYIPLDPAYPEERLDLMLDDSNAAVLLTERRLAGNLTPHAAAVVYIDEQWEEICDESDANLRVDVSPDNLAYIIYTSGSTGRPKGVMISHRSLVNSTVARFTYYKEPVSSFLLLSSFAFDSSVAGIFWSLCQAATLTIPPEGFQSDLPMLARLIAQSGVSHMLSLPSLYALLLEHSPPEQLRSMRAVIVAGEASPKELIQRHKEVLPQASIYNEYGPTEAAVWSTVYDCDSPGDKAHVSIGRPITNMKVHLLDKHLRPAPIGVPAELYIGGIGLSRGYLNRPDLTAERFIPDPLGGRQAGRLYKTGDLARYWPDGNIEFLGRVDNQVKVRGFRIELEEIESHLRAHPAVAEAVVAARRAAGGENQLVGYVVPESGESTATDSLRSYLKERLPDYMVPSAFVTLKSLPLTPNGKTDRNALPNPDSARPQLVAAYVPPQTEAQRLIADVWQEVLHVDKAGIDDNFFDLGGHSLVMVVVRNKLQRLFNKEISVVEMFKFPTIRALAEHLVPEAGDRNNQGRAEPQARGGQINGRRLRSELNDIAIVGMSGRFPGAGDIEQFWRNLRDGVESISFFSDEELEPSILHPRGNGASSYVKAKAILEDVEMFDASFFGINPREAEVMDPQHRIFLECAWLALEDAGYDPQAYAGVIGVFAGVSTNTYLINNLLPNRWLLESVGIFQTTLGNDKDFLPTRVSYKLGLKGPSLAVQTACSTSLVTVHMACQSLLSGESDMAMAGAVSVRLPQKSGYMYQQGGINSPDGHCRAFDARAQGTVSGNGVGIVVLKRLDDALADGDHIHAVIKASAINNDGSLKAGYTAPGVEGQASVIKTAQMMAGVNPETVTYVEAHGTGTALGDPIEVSALTEAFRAQTEKKGFCAIGSVKTNLGHLDVAAGMAGLIKTVLALKHKMVPPSLHFDEPNRQIDFASTPFYVNNKLSEWKAGDTPRRAGINSFGIGGTNAHVVLEEPPPIDGVGDSRPYNLLPLSHKTSTGLDKATANLLRFLKENKDANLADVAYTLQAGRRHFNNRRVIICADSEDAISALESGDARRVLTSYESADEKDLIFMFPGQGSQHVNMARGLYEQEPVFRAEVDLCSELLKPLIGLDLREILYPSEENAEWAGHEIEQTYIAQPALFVIEYALARQLGAWGIQPRAMIGHSVGEYTAACLAGVMSLEDTLALLTSRGRLMQSLPGGAMLAVSLTENDLHPQLDGLLQVAAVNGPELCVVSGPLEAVESMHRRWAEQGVACHRLQTSHAFHSAMMRPVVGEFESELRKVKLNRPKVPYISNLTGTWIRPEEATSIEYWSRHLLECVRFAAGLRELLLGQPGILLEVGPGQALTTIAKRQPEAGAESLVLPTSRHPRETVRDEEVLHKTLGRLWLAGARIDWPEFHAGQRRHRVALPTYPFERQRYWIEPQPEAPGLIVEHTPFEKKNDIADWFSVPVWKPSLPPASPQFFDPDDSASCWLVFADNCGLGARLTDRLDEKAQQVITVLRGEGFSRLSDGVYSIDPGRRDDYFRLIKDLKSSMRIPRRIAHLWSITASDPGSRLTALAADEANTNFYSLLYLAQALAGESISDEIQVGVVSNDMQDINGDGSSCPTKATLLGPCRVIPREHPNIACRSIDISFAQAADWQLDRAAEQLLAELASESTSVVIAYRGSRRWVQSFESLRLNDEPARPALLRGRGVYLITGGLGGVGFAFAQYLAQTVKARIALVQRSAFPARENWEEWLETHGADDDVSLKIVEVRALEQQGAAFLILSADVSDRDQMAKSVAAVYETFGELHGVIHAAGVPGGGIIELKTREGAESVLRPKVEGTLALSNTLGDARLDFFVLCSSLGSILGEFGAVDYCAANAFLDAFAHFDAARNGRATVSINWDTWQEVGMAFKTQVPSELKKKRQEALDKGIRSGEGCDALGRILKSRLPQVIVSTRDLQAAISRNNNPEVKDLLQVSIHPRPDLKTPYVAAGGELERRIADIWEELLGINPIGVGDNFFELGGDSLLAVLLTSRLRKSFQIELQLSSFFETPTIKAISEIIEKNEGNGSILGEPAMVSLARNARHIKRA